VDMICCIVLLNAVSPPVCGDEPPLQTISTIVWNQ